MINKRNVCITMNVVTNCSSYHEVIKWNCQLSTISIHLLNRSIVNKIFLLISLQTITFCAVFKRGRSNFHLLNGKHWCAILTDHCL